MKKEEVTIIYFDDRRVVTMLLNIKAFMSDLCREGNYCHSYGQSCSHGDDDSNRIMKGGNGSNHVRQTQGDQNLCGKSELKVSKGRKALLSRPL